jgi:hypothetical protein
LRLAAQPAERVRGPDGTDDWFNISCRHSESNCYAKAGEVCPGGYVIADSSQRNGVYVSANVYAVTAVPVHRGELLNRCKGPSGP